jgi:hypothetical protein
MGVPATEENPKALELQTTIIAIKSQNQTSISSKPKQTNKQTNRSLKLPQQQIPEKQISRMNNNRKSRIVECVLAKEREEMGKLL